MVESSFVKYGEPFSYFCYEKNLYSVHEKRAMPHCHKASYLPEGLPIEKKQGANWQADIHSLNVEN